MSAAPLGCWWELLSPSTQTSSDAKGRALKTLPGFPFCPLDEIGHAGRWAQDGATALCWCAAQGDTALFPHQPWALPAVCHSPLQL